MATNTERIDELSRLANQLATQQKLIERELERVQLDVESLQVARDELRKVDEDGRVRIAVLEREIENHKKSREEWGRRGWSLLVPIVTTVIGAVLGILGTIAAYYLNLKR